MPWTVKWHDHEERVLVLTPSDPWEWGDLDEATQIARALTGGKPYTVDLIYYFTGDVRLPRSPEAEPIAPWVRLREHLLNAPDNRGLVIIVAAPLYIESIVRNLQSVVKGQTSTDHIRFAETLIEADAMIEKARAGRDE